MPCKGILGSVAEKRREVDFEWTLENYTSTEMAKGDSWKSPVFRFCGSSWFLSVSPSGSTGSKVGHIALFLTLKSPHSKQIISFTVRIKKSDGMFVENISSTKRVFKDGKSSSWGWLNFVESKLLPTDHLHITCQMKNEESVEIISRPEKLMKLETLSKNFEDLFNCKRKWDVTINVKNQQFKAHQTVLMARSSVLAAALEQDMTGKKTGIITIEDCDPDYFGNFLEYLYTGKIEDLSFRDALSLYVTAGKYNVKELKSICVSHMQQNMTVKNFFDVVILAEKYDETELMSSAQDFFNRNFSKIISTSEWETLLKNNYSIVDTLLKGMSSKDEI